MSSDFSRCLSLLRQEKGISQRAAAKDLGISQALLSHYENGVREPGLAFVTKACNYYNVSADFLLGRTLSRDGTTIAAEELYDYSTEKDNVLHGSIMATLNKKLLVNSIGVLFDLLGKTGRKEAINAAADYLGTAVYKMFRHLYRADGSKNEDFFSVPARQFMAGRPGRPRQGEGELPAHAQRRADGELPRTVPVPAPDYPQHRGAGQPPDGDSKPEVGRGIPDAPPVYRLRPGGATGTMPLNGRGGRSRDMQSIAPMSIDAFTSSEVYFFDRPEQNPQFFDDCPH